MWFSSLIELLGECVKRRIGIQDCFSKINSLKTYMRTNWRLIYPSLRLEHSLIKRVLCNAFCTNLSTIDGWIHHTQAQSISNIRVEYNDVYRQWLFRLPRPCSASKIFTSDGGNCFYPTWGIQFSMQSIKFPKFSLKSHQRLVKRHYTKNMNTSKTPLKRIYNAIIMTTLFSWFFCYSSRKTFCL